MKLNYYGYLVERHSDEEQFVFDINPLLSAFYELDAPEFKSRFHYGGESLYLIRIRQNVYLYLMSKSQEIIKKIKETDLTVTGIFDLLEEHEKLGFASYLVVGDGYLGFASTVLAPKAVSFGKFINDIFDSLGLADYKFIMRPLLHEATAADVVQMPIHGKAMIEINNANTIFRELRDLFGGDVQDFTNVGSIEITFKPQSRKSIDPAIRKVIENLPADGVERFMVRAKENAADHLSDIFITGKGAISDMVKKGSDQEVSENIRLAVQTNQLLQEKVNEHVNDANTQQATPQAINAYFHAPAWAAAVARLQVPDDNLA
ncbi:MULTISPECIES: hypothetical protein [Pseudohongiella]|uniref:Uncharacterized protein n=1 Tax=marine sediment metagenome TaxID=412755 RepID=A0A0F9YQB3_9ZZZZ|nr:hypothetical protein [Pseudohongiella sp.]HDZ10062.1 hypothetical protein [Pseudohongiella sp.]HEA63411.1 hypothetical protein [Pseudohongiella sp.]